MTAHIEKNAWWPKRIRRIAGIPVVLLSLSSSSCERALSFSTLVEADRIDVRTSSDRQVQEIKDPKQVEAAVDFIIGHSTGWSNNWAGPLIPDLMLYFYKGSRRLGGFGVSRDHLVADPITGGWLSRPVDPDALAALTRGLGLHGNVR